MRANLQEKAQWTILAIISPAAALALPIPPGQGIFLNLGPGRLFCRIPSFFAEILLLLQP